MPFVIRVNRFESGQNLVHRVEPEQALADGKNLAEPGVLGNHRTTGSEIACASLAEPATTETHVLVLGDRKFHPRTPDIVPIVPGIRRKGMRIHEPPPVRLQHAPDRWLQVTQAYSKFERLLDAPGQVNELQELVVLAPIIGLTLILDVASVLLPVADGGDPAFRTRTALP